MFCPEGRQYRFMLTVLWANINILPCSCLCCRCANIVSLQCWMAKYGQQLQTLRLLSVADSMGLVLQLCPHLQHLSLHSCDVDVTLCSRANLFNSISTATALSSLHINKCRLLVSRGSRKAAETAVAQVLSALAPLTAFRELSVCGVGACARAPDTFPDAPSAHLLLPTAFLQPLQHLTQLHLQAKHKKEGGVLQHIGSMTDLQDLRLGGVNGAPLQLAVTQLTALTKLRRLGLRGVSLECRSAVKSGANIAALLAWLPMLQGLSSLQLRAVAGLCAWGRPELWRHFPAATAYSALTAGSALQHIDLRSTEFSQGACEHAFPLEGTLTNITSLRFGPHYDDACLPLDDYLRCAVASCPNLRELQSCESNERQPLLSYHTAAMSGWSLQQRTSLTRLTMHVCHAEWGEQLELLGMLTQLKSLQLVGMDVHTLQETVDALWPLISLTWLSCLSLGVRLAHPHREGQDFVSVV